MFIATVILWLGRKRYVDGAAGAAESALVPARRRAPRSRSAHGAGQRPRRLVALASCSVVDLARSLDARDSAS